MPSGGVLARRMGAYTLIQVAGFIAPFAALPVIARSTTTAGWSSLGLGQAIGGMAGIVILYGWWTVGPSEYVRYRSREERHALYRRSLVERLAVALPVLPLSCVGAALVVDDGYVRLGVLSVIGAANLGLSPSWYFIAEASPWKLAAYETGPRILASGVSAVAVAITDEVMIYPVLLAVLPVLAYAVALRRETPRSHVRVLDRQAIRTDLRRQIPIAGANILGGLYSQLMVPYVAVVAPTHLAGFVSGDRLYKAGRFTITAAGNTFQPWTLENPTPKRHLTAVAGHGALGLAGFLASWLLMPPVSRVMFGDDLGVPSVLAAGLGAGFFFNSLLTPLIRNILIPQGHRYVPLAATVSAAAVGVVTVAALHGPLGVGAIALAIGGSEAVCLAICAAAVVPLLRSTAIEPAVEAGPRPAS